MSKDLKYLDKSGRPITPGCFIVYAAAAGRSAVLKFGLVVEVTKSKGEYDNKPWPKIKAITVDNWYPGPELQNNGKPIFIGALERTLIIGPDQVDAKTAGLLSKASKSFNNEQPKNPDLSSAATAAREQ